MRATFFGGVLACAVLFLAAPGRSPAGEPPNQNDPCSKAGRDTCGTTGVGFYANYRYGIRWFGDFRGVVAGSAPTFCIDLRYWYPSAVHKYREDTSGTLTNREGEAVPVGKQQRLAYAIWAYGRSSNPNQQAAVMLYVHGLMGDAAPGEVDPSALNATVVAIYKKIAADADRYHGPYRIESKLPGGLNVGDKATATFRVLSAAGNALPNLELTLTTRGVSGVPGKVRTDGNGVARVALTATSAAEIQLKAESEPLASTLPRIYGATTIPAARNSQRLALPSSQRVVDTVTSSVKKNRIAVSTAAAPATLLVEEASRDKVTISGAAASWKGTVTVKIYGPFRSTGEISCSGTAASQNTFSATGSGVFTTPVAKLPAPGWYVYQEVVPGDANHIGLTTPCNVPSERFRVDVQPLVSTTVSAQTVVPGAPIFDNVHVEGLAGEPATVKAVLYGPFASAAAVKCTGQPVWSGSIDVTADGDYQTEPFMPTVAGYYSYRESIDAGGFVRATQTKCGDTAETSVVPGAPKLTTQVSAQEAKPGAKITDKVVVTGLGALSAQVSAELWGPFATRAAVRCAGTPYWKGSVTARGDGTYTTAPATIEKAGYYTYRESIAAGPANSGFSSTCAEASETTLVKAWPTVTTLVSNEVVYPGSSISDLIQVSGLGRTAAAIDIELFGPFATRSAISCSGRPYWQGRVTAQGDGELRSPPAKVVKAGFYTFRERIVASALVPEVVTDCGLVPETSLAAPQIITGRGDHPRYVRAASAGAATPTRVQLGSLGIDAPISPVGIDVAKGVLGVSGDIHRTGWWKDGMAPGAKSGAILIAGHVDSARLGAGAFFKLRRAKAGDRVQVTTGGGRTFTYRVVSVRYYLKSALPTSVYSQKGAARLVLVTCGGPFIKSAGHYRDNVVLTAVPA